MNEKKFSLRVRERVPHRFCQSFESALIPGVADLYMVLPRGGAVWLELKVMESTGAKIPFRPGQPQWLESHARAGGRSIVAVGVLGWAYFLEATRWRVLSRLPLRKVLETVSVIKFPLEGPAPWALCG